MQGYGEYFKELDSVKTNAFISIIFL